MVKFSRPSLEVKEKGVTYLFRTPEQVEEDLQRMLDRYPYGIDDEGFKAYWRKLLSAKVPVCPKCGEHGGPIRRTLESEILGCDKCLNIAGYVPDEDPDELVGVKEAAIILGWDPRKVATYRARGSFPGPIEELAMGPVWYRSQIEEMKRNSLNKKKAGD
jgi:hypothetical protein